MSYSRSYSETVSDTVEVSYPASEKGGYTSVTVDIPVYININVDTDPFDRSVQHCSNNVNLLTTAVVATEAAEIQSIDKNSKKVADTLIGGFFSYIRSEISQQVAELSQNIDAQLMHLKELAQSCLAKKKQMEGDYNRISNRYVKTFEDLNHELSNRIFELDKHTFQFKKETDKQKIRTSDNDLVNVVAIFGTESNEFQSKISASYTKKRALDTLNKAKLFLTQQKCLSNVIKQSMQNESEENTIYTPVCFYETSNTGNHLDRNIVCSDYFPALNDKQQKEQLIGKLASKSIQWVKIPQDDEKNLRIYLNNEINNHVLESNVHSERVKEMIQKLADLKLITVNN